MLIRGRVLEESLIVLWYSFCITCIKTLNLNICFVLRVMYQLLNYGNIVDVFW